MTERPYSDRILQLAEKWNNNSITHIERLEFIEWYNSFNDAELIWPGENGIKDEIFLPVINHIHEAKKTAFIFDIQKWKAIAAIAAAIVIVFLSINYFAKNSVMPGKKDTLAKVVMPTPGTDKAILILGNGKRIDLNDEKVIEDGENKITNKQNELVYNNTKTFSYNTMITPRGGQYKLQLPDGSKVWLNAESKIIYPTIFSENTRKVQIEGEAYFEIVKDKEKPFVVISNNGVINVLGTRFNINDYPEEQFKTTLLAGSVKVNDKIIFPGEAYTKEKVINVDTTEIISWKNGSFFFNKTDIQVVLRQLQRWYDLDVVYEGEMPHKTFVGELPRNAPLEQVLRILSKTGLVFSMEGNKMIVRK